MTIDTRTVLKNYEGEEMTVGEQEGKEVTAVPATLRKILVTALNTQLPTESFTPEEKARIYSLSVRLYNSDEVELSPEEIAFIKTRVGIIWNSVVYGRVCELLGN